ncbi:MAG: hypothetical protein P8Y18_08060 [Candidatus Bathyarchaeota archaeon]
METVNSGQIGALKERERSHPTKKALQIFLIKDFRKQNINYKYYDCEHVLLNLK